MVLRQCKRKLCVLGSGVVRDLDQRGTKQAILDAVAAAHFFQNLMVRVLTGLNKFNGFVLMRIELGADRLNRLHAERMQSVFHLLDDELYAGAELLNGAAMREGEVEVIEHGKELVYRTRNGVFTEVRALFGGALAGVVKLGLEAGKAVKEVIALGLNLFQLRGLRGGSFRLGNDIRGIQHFFVQYFLIVMDMILHKVSLYCNDSQLFIGC